MSRGRVWFAAALLALAALPGLVSPASAGLKLDRFKGHLSFGYAKLVSDSLAPGGSLSVAAGVEYPLRENWRLGPTASFNLLGSSSTKRGSVTAGLDYSVVDVAFMTTYFPKRSWVSRVSFGPGVASAHADLAVSAGGAAFRDLAVAQASPEFALDVTLMPRRMNVVGIGAEFGTRILPTDPGVWSVWTGRVAIHF
ncbi:MAG: hypothetical protein HZA61_04855 [Candidatus Eisenbacteria bacterium]|uniref:Outer membrane protein beta-barrel domain-containing protein n=1 Tax=Eiseniibacteriota bacterium TaxID=2212470 RepID=A0A933SBL4_UNCEI|nr:hypothetical protein [Candidatus Eisenbacteria bacterium]